MKPREWISPRTAIISIILVVLFMIIAHLYLRHDMQTFEANLPKVPTGEHVTEVLEPSFHAEEVASEPTQSVPEEDILPVVTVEGPVQESDSENIAVGGEACQHASSHMAESEVPSSGEPKLYAGMTTEELQALFAELQSELLSPPRTNVADANVAEKFDLLGEALLDKMGPDPRIPRAMSNFKTMHALSRMDSIAETDEFLNQLPAVVYSDLVEITIDLIDVSEEEVALLQQHVEHIKAHVDSLKLLQETRPMVQAAIEAGELSPKDGEVFIKSVTGLNVIIKGEDRASKVEEWPIPGVTEPNVPEFPQDSSF